MSANESKHSNMKQFISAARDFAQTRSESSASIINRHLQLLSVTIDLSTFDPHTSVVSEFFVSLHEVLSSLEPRSALAWCCVNVLSIACRNPAARTSLIHTYQFIPPLSRLLGDQLTNEKKIRLLNLMQELTCGIKISWQIPHLPYLMSTLTRWVESAEENIVILSLGVLVNLCYKNLSAIYTLSRCVDIKKFVRTCMTLKGFKIEVHVCKLLIILELMEGKVPDETLIKLVETTFKSMGEAFKAKDSILLRHIVEFFLDIKEQNGKTEIIASYPNYATEVEKLLDTVENFNKTTNAGDSGNLEPECMSLLLEFIHSLVEMKLPKLEPLYPRIISIAFSWIQTDLVCSQALAILRTIAINTKPAEMHILEPLLNGLPIFLVALNHRDEEIPTNIEYNKRLASLMQLLKSLLQAEQIKGKIVQSLQEDHIKNIFIPLVGDKSPRVRPNDADTYSPEAINMYIHALALLDELAKIDVEWVDLYTNLLQQKQIHMILAQALYNGSYDVRVIILGMASTRMFPYSYVANAMTELQHIVQTEVPTTSTSSQVPYMFFPTASVSQIERLDELINKLKEAIAQNDVSNIATSDVMELYDYKLASMGHAERAATASMEAASHRCTHLQHRNAQLTAELSRLHQLYFHTQQCHEDATQKNKKLESNIKELTNKLEAEQGRRKVVTSQLNMKEKTLQEKETELEELSKKCKDLEKTKSTVEAHNNELKNVLAKLEENLIKKEKLVEKKEELLSRANSQIDHFKTQLTYLEKQYQNKEIEAKSKTEKLAEVEKELEIRNQLIETITKLTNSQSFKK